MRIMLRVLAHVLLVLCLTLTSVTSAVAHMQSAGAQQIVLCGTPGVEQVITLDAFGNPVVTDHHCPDCLAATADLPASPPLPLRPLTRGEAQPMPPFAIHLTAPEIEPGARGPPARL